jgi:predicted dehydrogenase
VCDVFRPHREIAAQKTGGVAVNDYRRILDDPEIDAVVIATPDHWHARMAIDAAEAGKHIYLEALMTRTWQEAVQVHDAVKKNRVIFQCGAQLCSDDRYHQAAQILKNGSIGKLLYAQATLNRNSRVGFYNRRIWDDVNEQNLDWKAWLGAAPDRPMDPERFVRWRKYWDYSGGSATNLLFGLTAAMLVATGTELPRRVSAAGGRYLEGDGETPDTYFTTIDYENHSLNLTCCLGNEQSTPAAIFGHEGTIRLEDTFEIVRERYFSAEFKEREGQGRLNVVETARPDHVRQWLECLRTGATPTCHEGIAKAAMIAAHLGELAYRESRVVSFDRQRLQVSSH